jgi:bacterioferritin (cytochrome b1)
METLATYNREKVIDLLSERLEFERAGVKLYDTILEKIEGATDPNVSRLLPDMRKHRDQEKEHEEWLEEQIRSLGGDANKKTEMAELTLRESKGIEEVVSQDDQVTHLFHALLTAELVDNAGWELLIELADDADDREARREFKQRLHEEEDHLIFARQAVLWFARKDVLGYERRIAAAE